MEECLSRVRSLNKSIKALFLRGNHPMSSFEDTQIVIPMVRGFVGSSEFPAIAWLSSSLSSHLRTRSYEVRGGVGRWLTGGNASKVSEEAPIAEGHWFGASPYKESCWKFVSTASDAATVVAFKCFPTPASKQGLLHYAALSASPVVNPLSLRTLTEVHRITAHSENVVSGLENCALLGSLQEMPPESLFIQTGSGRVAQVIVGNPARGTFALDPVEFSFKADDPGDLHISFGVPDQLERIRPASGLNVSEYELRPEGSDDIALVQVEKGTIYGNSRGNSFIGQTIGSIHFSEQ